MKPDSPGHPPAVVLGVAAHPDDLDFGAGGTVASLAAGGTAVHYLILTDGSKGSADRQTSPPALIATRRREQLAAAKRLGVSRVYFLDYEDGALECSLALKQEIASHIRRLKPEVVITLDPTFVYSAARGLINHPDHRAAGQATLDAVYPLARDHLSFPDLLAQGLQPHSVSSIWLINFDQHNYAVDISAFIDKKLAALKAHRSQMPDFEATARTVRQLAAEAGQASGCQLAEAFMKIDIT